VSRKSQDNHTPIYPGSDYVAQVLDGSIPVCKLTLLAVERHTNDLLRAADDSFPYYFDIDHADIVVQFIESFCRHSKGEYAGQEFILEPWQRFIISCVFGWKKKKDNLRRFKTVYTEIARKNGKSTLLAAIGIVLLICDGEAGAEIYSAATKKDQARIIFDEAARMIKSSPELKGMVQCTRNNMCVLETHSKFEPLSSDEDSLDGLNIHGGLIDELHAHKSRKVFDVLETATGSRRQPLIYCITTAGFSAPDSICLELRGYGEKILSGILEDESFFAIIYTIDPDDNWLDPVNWKKANPNLGISVKEDDLAPKCLKAKETPAAQNNFKCKHLNVWVNSRSRWLSVAQWDKGQRDFDAAELHGKECYGGLDLSTTTDISALSLTFPWGKDESGNDVYRALQFYWVPQENAHARARKDRVTYPLWIEQGFIEGTPGNVIDYDLIRRRINELSEIFNIREIAADRWNSTQIIQQLEGDGLKMMAMGQGFQSLSAPSKMFEALVLGERLHHKGDPVTRWMVDNLSVRTDPAGNIKPDKEKSTERVDGCVSLIMSIDRAALRKPAATNPYESRGLTVI
jgi:phage terminase large subunit-like protein